MPRWSLLVVLVLTLVGVIALGGVARIGAQEEATPSGDEFVLPEGVSFEPLAFGATDTLELELFRLTLDPGAILPIEADDPTTGLVHIESGTLTARVEATMMVTRAGTFEALFASPEAGATDEEGIPPSEEIPAGTEFQLAAGDSALFPANTPGEVRNDGSEPVVFLVSLVGPLSGQETPEA